MRGPFVLLTQSIYVVRGMRTHGSNYSDTVYTSCIDFRVSPAASSAYSTPRTRFVGECCFTIPDADLDGFLVKGLAKASNGENLSASS